MTTKEQEDTQANNNVVKKRSSLRCHLVSRMPFFDRDGQTIMYELKFTKGNVFITDSLHEEHNYHILMGFFIRRSIDRFIGKDCIAAIRIPISSNLVELASFYQTSKLCIILSPSQEPTKTVLHQIHQLNRLNVKFAIDLDTLLVTKYMNVVHCLNYVLIEAKENLSEELLLCQQLKSFSAKLKTIAIDIDDIQMTNKCFLNGVDYVNTKFYESPELVNSHKLSVENNLEQDIRLMINEIFKDEPNFTLLSKIIGRYSFMVANILQLVNQNNLANKITNMAHAVTYLGTQVMRNLIGVLCTYTLFSQFHPDAIYNGKKPTKELLKYALIRARFVELLIDKYGNKAELKLAFEVALFSVLDDFKSGFVQKQSLLYSQIHDLIINQDLEVYYKVYQCIKCIRALEDSNLSEVIKIVATSGFAIGHVLQVYEDAIIWSEQTINLM